MIRETDTKIGKEAAMKLSRLNPEQQKEAAVMLASGKVRSVEQYKEIKAPQPPKEPSQSAPDGQIDSKDEVPQSTLAQPAPSRAVDDDAPYRLPDKHFNSFEESIADLKNSDKDSSSTPDIFLAEYSGFVRKFMREFQWFTMPHYAVVFSHLTDAQVKYLQAQNASMREALDGLLQQIEKEKKHEL